MTLDQAAGDDQAFEFALTFQLGSLLDLMHRLVFGRFEEPAGIHDHGVGVLTVRDRDQPVLGELAEHFFGVHEVLGAAQADKGHRPHAGFGGRGAGGFGLGLLRCQALYLRSG
ncbi:MAG: hypothetical protein R3C45_07880 [Phycisphaerales bacterium]